MSCICDQGFFAIENSGINLVTKIGIQIIHKSYFAI
jgi:hypothetical protein